jgi:hypothetical protein
MTSKMERAEKKLTEVVALLGAQELAEVSGGFAHDVYRKAVDETRVDAAGSIEAHFIQRTDRSMYRGESPDQCIIDMLTEQAETAEDGTVTEPLITDPALRQLGVDFGQDGVSDDFRQGIRFALMCLGSLDYDI